MKQRIIRGLSKIPVRALGLEIKRIGAAPVGEVAVHCPACQKISYRKPSRKAAVCPMCHNVELEFSPKLYELARSVVRVESFAANTSLRLSNESVYNWCKEHINSRSYRLWLSLDTVMMVPKLNGNRVPSRVYYNTLRFVMLNMVATNTKHLKFLDKNNVNIIGVAYLRRAEVLDRIMSNQDPNEDDARRTGLGGFADFGERLSAYARRSEEGNRSYGDIVAILEAYGVPPTIFGDFDEN